MLARTGALRPQPRVARPTWCRSWALGQRAGSRDVDRRAHEDRRSVRERWAKASCLMAETTAGANTADDLGRGRASMAGKRSASTRQRGARTCLVAALHPVRGCVAAVTAPLASNSGNEAQTVAKRLVESTVSTGVQHGRMTGYVLGSIRGAKPRSPVASQARAGHA